MAKYAVIENNKVTNIIEAKSADIFEGITLIKATGNTKLGDIWNGKTFEDTPTPPKTLEDNIREFDTQILTLEGQITEIEKPLFTASVDILDDDLTDDEKKMAKIILKDLNKSKKALLKDIEKLIKDKEKFIKKNTKQAEG